MTTHSSAEEIKKLLQAALPSALHSKVDTLAELLFAIANGTISKETFQSVIEESNTLQKLVQALDGQNFSLPIAQISFGSDSQTGDIKIRDVVGRDVIGITINYYSSGITPQQQLHTMKEIIAINSIHSPISPIDFSELSFIATDTLHEAIQLLMKYKQLQLDIIHVFISLVQMKHGATRHIFHSLNVDLPAMERSLRKEVQKIPRSFKRPQYTTIYFTPRIANIIRRLKTHYQQEKRLIEDYDILIAIIQLGGEDVTRIMNTHNLNAEIIYEKVSEVKSDNSGITKYFWYQKMVANLLTYIGEDFQYYNELLSCNHTLEENLKLIRFFGEHARYTENRRKQVIEKVNRICITSFNKSFYDILQGEENNP